MLISISLAQVQAVVLVAKGHGLTYLKAVAGLLAMLPMLREDRAAVKRVRVRADRDVLRSDAMVARADLIGHPLARAGKLANFTGIDSPYEVPEAPELHLRTDRLTIDAAADLVITALKEAGRLRD